MAIRGWGPMARSWARGTLKVSKDVAEQKLAERIAIGYDTLLKNPYSPDCRGWADYNVDLLGLFFWEPAPSQAYLAEYQRFDFIGSGAFSFLPCIGRRNNERDLARHLAFLESLKARLPLMPVQSRPLASTGTMPPRAIFIAHGRDEVVRLAVVALVRALSLVPVVLEDLPPRGLTLIESVEEHSAGCGYGIVLVTPDDIGALADGVSPPEQRARNVVFEAGYLMGYLGRNRVCIVTKGSVHMPSDLDGVKHIPYEPTWQSRLASELTAAGYLVDANRLQETQASAPVPRVPDR